MYNGLASLSNGGRATAKQRISYKEMYRKITRRKATMLVAHATANPTTNAFSPMILMARYFTLNPTPANAVANRKALPGFTKDAAMELHSRLVIGTERSA